MKQCGKVVATTQTTAGPPEHRCVNPEGHWWPCGITRPATIKVILDMTDGRWSMGLKTDWVDQSPEQASWFEAASVEVTAEHYEQWLALCKAQADFHEATRIVDSATYEAMQARVSEHLKKYPPT